MTILDKVAARRAAGLPVWSLCAGEPVEGAPADVRRLAREALDSPLGYTSTFGLLELRAAIAGHYRRWYDLDVDPAQICLTTGASGAFMIGFLAGFDAGDRIALARPGYPAYWNILRTLGCEVVELDCGAEERFQPTPDVLDDAGPLDGLVVASPANPTGTMVSDAQLAELTQWCAAHGARFVSDEIYHGLTDSDSPGSCAWSHDRSSLVIGSFSKFWGMTGWRLGWMLVPEDLVDAVDAIAGNVALCAPVPAQYAALGAFTEDSYAEGRARVARHARAREIVLRASRELGWGAAAPADGAFYVYVDISPVLGRHADARAWCADLLDATGVAVTPGIDFDHVAGRHTIRISLAAGEKVVSQAMTRIAAWQQTRQEPASRVGAALRQ